jgi:archaellum biogenesis ATPase FlaH
MNISKTNTNLKLQQALYLSEKMKWSIIPVGRDKKPLVAWKKYQSIRPTIAEITQWFTQYPEANIAVITGKQSNVVVVDIDPRHNGSDKEFNHIITVKSKTGGGGYHYFFLYEEGIQNHIGIKEGIDIRGEGGLVVVPPSLHESGNHYEWIMSPHAGTPVLPLPSFIKDWIHNAKSNSIGQSSWSSEKLKGVEEGARNQTAASVAGKLLVRFPKDEWESEAWPLLQAWNARNIPPLPEHELRATFESIATRESKKLDNKTIGNTNYKPLPLKELMSKEFKDTQWVIEQLIPAETIVAISGLPSAYKTWLVLDIALKVAKGEMLFDKFITNQTGVLLIDEETGERWIQQRIFKLQDVFDIQVYLLSKTGFKLTEETVKWLIAFTREYKIGLIIFDSLLRIHTARDENDAVEMAKVFSLFQKLTREGITVIFTHHNRKPGILRSSSPSQDMRGSSDILAAVDSHLAVERKDNFLVVNQTKLRQEEEILPFKLNIISETNEFRFEFAGEVDEEKTKKADMKQAIKDILQKADRPMYKSELYKSLISEGIEGGYSTFKSAVKELVEKTELFEKKGEKNKVFCSLKPFNEN